MEEYKDPTEEIKEKSRKREDYFRCKTCKMLWEDVKAVRDPVSGVYRCPNGCARQYVQPDYELPTQG